MHVSRLLAGAILSAAAVQLLRAARGLPTALGAPEDALRAAADASRHARDGIFANSRDAPAPGTDALRPEGVPVGTVLRIARVMLARGTAGRPTGDVPLVAGVVPPVAAPLAVTWFGHSSALLEVDGCRVLVDPVWGERVSPSPLIGPRRLHAAPVPLDAVPSPDAVLISHDHYDHLDLPTVRALLRRTTAPFVVPVGVGAHLRHWGAPPERIVELDWDDSTEVAGLRLTCTEAQHFSGRGLRRNTTLWSSWAVTGPRHRVFFGGDTGYTPAFAAIRERLGPFDLTLLPVGAYSDRWPLVHMDPDEAVRAHCDLAGSRGLLVPVHWATFNLGFHPWAEPVERTAAAAAAVGARIAVPRPGERIDVASPPAPDGWWRAVA